MDINELTAQIMAYECGELDDQDTIDMFQGLVDTGLAWTLQGHYGRTAAMMLRQGILVAPKSPLVPGQEAAHAS